MNNTQTIRLLYKSDIRSNNGSDIAIMYNIDEIKAMEDVREEEKQSCINHYKLHNYKGYIYYAHTTIPMFVGLKAEDYEEV